MEFANGVNVPLEMGWYAPTGPSTTIACVGRTAMRGFLGVPLTALAARPNAPPAPQSRMAWDTAHKIIREVVSDAGVLLVSESMRLAGWDYTQHALSIDLRAACVPSATSVFRPNGHAVAVLPVVILPLVAARAGRWLTAGRSIDAFRAFVERVRADALIACGADSSPEYEMYARLFMFVLSTPSWWGPLAPAPSSPSLDDDHDIDSVWSLTVDVDDVLHADKVMDMVHDMLVSRVYTMNVTYRGAIAHEANAILAAIADMPGRPFTITLTEREDIAASAAATMQ